MENSRELLLKAAAEMFYKQGYERTNMRDLAEKVGLTSGTIFYYFKTKEQILLEVMIEGIRRANEALDEELAKANSTRERLLALFKAHLRVLLRDATESMASFLYEMRSLSPENRRHIIELRDAYEKKWQQVMDEAAREGLIAANTRITRLFCLGAVNWTINWYKTDGPYDVDALANELLRIVTGQ